MTKPYDDNINSPAHKHNNCRTAAVSCLKEAELRGTTSPWHGPLHQEENSRKSCRPITVVVENSKQPNIDIQSVTKEVTT